MYTSPVPLMVIRADVDALIELNGRLLGECEKGSYLASPVSDAGDYYVCVTPLSAGRYAITRKLSLEDGLPAGQLPPDVSVCIWPGGVIEFMLQTGGSPEASPRPLETIDEAVFSDYSLSLCLSEDMQLYAERDGRPFCRYSLGDYESGDFSPYREWMGLILYGRDERLLLFDNELQTALDVRGDAVFLENAPICIERLPTLLRHEKRSIYSYNGSSFSAGNPELGFFTRKRPYPKDSRELGLAFFEALREGFAEEAGSYLSRELRSSFSLSEIASFIGPFFSVRTPLSDSSGQMFGLCELTYPYTQKARLYRLAFKNGLISNISEEE